MAQNSKGSLLINLNQYVYIYIGTVKQAAQGSQMVQVDVYNMYVWIKVYVNFEANGIVKYNSWELLSEISLLE